MNSLVMKKVLLCLLVCLLLIPLLLAGSRSVTEEGVTRCLLVGCDRFVSMPGTEPMSWKDQIWTSR